MEIDIERELDIGMIWYELTIPLSEETRLGPMADMRALRLWMDDEAKKGNWSQVKRIRHRLQESGMFIGLYTGEKP